MTQLGPQEPAFSSELETFKVSYRCPCMHLRHCAPQELSLQAACAAQRLKLSCSSSDLQQGMLMHAHKKTHTLIHACNQVQLTTLCKALTLQSPSTPSGPEAEVAGSSSHCLGVRPDGKFVPGLDKSSSERDQVNMTVQVP